LQVAIKKVLQDKRFKNRELQIIRIMEHPNVVMLKYNFFSVTERDERFLHLVLEFIPSTVYKCVLHTSSITYAQGSTMFTVH
jgi:hypothetical protein